MRVLVISAAFPPMHTGESTNTLHLCQHLADRGLDVHVLTSQSNAHAEDRRITVHPIMRGWSWLEVWRLRQFLRRCSPDGVLLMYIDFIYDDHPMITFSPTISRALLPSVPFVTRFENPIGNPPRTPSIANRIWRKAAAHWADSKDVDYRYGTLLRDSHHVIVLAKRHLDHLSAIHPPVRDKSSMIPPPPNIHLSPANGGETREAGRRALGLGADDFAVAYLGYIYPNKGIETLLEAFQIVSNERRNVRLVVMGGAIDSKYRGSGSYVQEMHELAERLGIDDRVIWTGEFAANGHEASVYLRGADACVLPFDAGVQLNNSSFAAAAAHGLPIVTTRGKVLDQQFVDGQSVLLCPSKSPHEMAEAIEKLIAHPELRRRLSAGSAELAGRWFSWDTAIERTLATWS